MTEVSHPIAVGKPAPDFALEDQDEKEHRLSGQHGRRVLLSFHPLAWTSVCAQQMKDLESHFDVFAGLSTIAWGMSIDHAPCKAAWAKSLAITKTSLLCDFWPHGAVAELYGLFRPKDGFSERANVIIDENGKVVFVKVYPIDQLPDLGPVLEALKRL
jgi:peroxiredoxin